jgi:arabinofuranosyltransferase
MNWFHRFQSVQKSWIFTNLFVAICLLVGFAVVLFTSIRLWHYVADDTYIALRYSQHFAQGKGLVFNQGERVDGYTDFLWVIYLTLPFLLNIDPVTFLKVTNIILIFFSAILIFVIGRKTYFRDFPALSVFPALLFLATPFISISAAEGLETCLFIFLLLLTLYLFLREEQHTFPFSVITMTALALTRPDGILYLPIFFIASLMRGAKRKYIYSYLSLFAIIIVPLFIWHYVYYGALLPNTFYAKPGGSFASIILSIHNLSMFLKDSSFWIVLFFLPPLFKKKLTNVNFIILGLIFVRLLFHIWSGGAVMGLYRFLVPILPFIYMLIFAGIVHAKKNNVTLVYTIIIVIGVLLYSSWRCRSSAILFRANND